MRSVGLTIILAFGFLWAIGQGKMGVTVNHPYDYRMADSYYPNTPVDAAHIEAGVRQLLPHTEGSTLNAIQATESPAMYHVLYQQYYAGMGVFQATIKVNIDKEGTIRSLFDNSFTTGDWDWAALQQAGSAIKNISDEQVLQALQRQSELDIEPATTRLKREPVILAIDQDPEVVLKVRLHDATTHAHHLFLLKADKAILYQRDLNRYHGQGQSIPADALVFMPDPLTTAHTTYGTPYVDDNDLDIGVLNDERVSVTVEVEESGGTYFLRNNYVEVAEFSGPTVAPKTSTSASFNYGRSESGFEDVMVLYHMTRYQQYMQSLGFTNLVDYAIEVDAHALNGADNSMFSSGGSQGQLFFGEGGVDDAEDADVIIHEYGHAISHSAAPGTNFGQERQSLDEGFGDYLATSYTRAIDTFQWQNMFTWDGHNEFWSGRNAASTKIYPDDLNGSIHSNGEIWNSALMEVWEVLGHDTTDRLVLQSMYSYSGGMSMNDAARLVLQADTILYGGAHFCDIYPLFTARGLIAPMVNNPCDKMDNSLAVDAGTDRNYCYGDTVQAGNPDMVESGYTYLWQPSAGLTDSTSPAPGIFTDEPRTYTLRVTTPDGRYNTDAITITPELCGIQIWNTQAFADGIGSLQVQISTSSNKHYIELFNLNGQRIMYRKQSSHQATINSAGMAPGVYLLRIRSGNQQVVKKLVKVR